MDEMTIVPGTESFPWVWCCRGCVTDDDRHALDERRD
jgi:hypothetical protein